MCLLSILSCRAMLILEQAFLLFSTNPVAGKFVSWLLRVDTFFISELETLQGGFRQSFTWKEWTADAWTQDFFFFLHLLFFSCPETWTFVSREGSIFASVSSPRMPMKFSGIIQSSSYISSGFELSDAGNVVTVSTNPFTALDRKKLSPSTILSRA